MRKIPTLFVRDFEHDNGRYVTRQVNFGCGWVMEGLGVATRKVDGTGVLIDAAGSVWARREVKTGKAEPTGFRPVGIDPETGKTVGWEPYRQSGWAKFIDEALTVAPGDVLTVWKPGTYELLGPKVNRNPEGHDSHVLHPHGQHGAESVIVQRTFDGIMEFLLINHRGWEGLVFWREPGNIDAPMAKIKARDFRQ